MATICSQRHSKISDPSLSSGRWIPLRIAASFFLLSLVIGCTPQRFFYYPNRTLYVDPDKIGLQPELLRYPSLNGKILTALLFKTHLPPKGTVVHFHGNFGNLSNHFPLSLFLLKQGFDVISFDYEGYGASEGTPSPAHLRDDGIASVRYAQAHLRPGAAGVVVFGQSLGGATAIVVTAVEPDVKAAVIEAAFSSHSKMCRAVLLRHWFTWPLAPIIPLFVNHRLDPIKFVGRISPRPVLFIHGEEDKIVPVEMSKELFRRAGSPRELWIVPGAGHLEVRRQGPAEYDRRISEFFSLALSKGNTPS